MPGRVGSSSQAFPQDPVRTNCSPAGAPPSHSAIHSGSFYGPVIPARVGLETQHKSPPWRAGACMLQMVYTIAAGNGMEPDWLGSGP